MPRDLLSELQNRRDTDSPDETEAIVIEMENNNSEMEPFKMKTQTIQEGIDKVKEFTQRVRDIHAEILSKVDSDGKTEELEDIMAQVKRTASRIRTILKEVQAEAEKSISENPTSAKARMKVIQQQSLSKLFVDAMTGYNEAQMEYRDKCKERIKRQLIITGKNPDDEELEEMLESGDAAVFTQSALNQSEKAKQALADVQARHQDIIKLEESVRELRDLFLEMAVLVESQGQMIDRIEYSVANAAEFVAQAKTETKTAQEYQKAATKKKIWLIGIILIVILIILLCIMI